MEQQKKKQQVLHVRTSSAWHVLGMNVPGPPRKRPQHTTHATARRRSQSYANQTTSPHPTPHKPNAHEARTTIHIAYMYRDELNCRAALTHSHRRRRRQWPPEEASGEEEEAEEQVARFTWLHHALPFAWPFSSKRHIHAIPYVYRTHV